MKQISIRYQVFRADPPFLNYTPTKAHIKIMHLSLGIGKDGKDIDVHTFSMLMPSGYTTLRDMKRHVLEGKTKGGELLGREMVTLAEDVIAGVECSGATSFNLLMLED